MAAKGRPRLTPEQFQARVAAYCSSYGVSPGDTGMPPFPAGQRETPQHREWLSLYKAHNRLARRAVGQCERCQAPVAEGSIFCVDHRDGLDVAGDVPPNTRRSLLSTQSGGCPICGKPVALSDPVDREPGTGRIRGVLHPRCLEIVALAEEIGRGVLAGLELHLGWDDSENIPF